MLICPRCRFDLSTRMEREKIDLIKMYFCNNCGENISEILKKTIKKECQDEFNPVLLQESNQIEREFRKELQQSLLDKPGEYHKVIENREKKDDIDEGPGDNEIAHISLRYKDKKYIQNNRYSIDIEIANTSEENLKDLKIEYCCLSGNEYKSYHQILNKKTHVIDEVYFVDKIAGDTCVDLTIEYLDSKYNLSIYRARQRYAIHEKERSISQQFIGEVKFEQRAVDNSGVVYNIGSLGGDYKARLSRHSDEEEWMPLSVVFDSEATREAREKKEKQRNREEGEKRLREAEKVFNNIDSRQTTDVKLAALKQAYDLFHQANDFFGKVLQQDQDESVLKIIKKNKEYLENINGQIEEVARKPFDRVKQPVLKSGKLLFSNGKTIFLYSKMPLTLGRLPDNDIVLRVKPYLPQEKYIENFEKNGLISRHHARIVAENNLFYLLDGASSLESSTKGTFLNGKRIGREIPGQQIKDKAHASIAEVLDLEFQFFWDSTKVPDEEKYLKKIQCETIYGSVSKDCFGVEKRGNLNAIKIVRKNNFTKEEKYVVLIKEITLGSSSSNAVVLEGKNISDIHARLFFRDQHYWIEDLNSLHGVFLNNRKLIPLEASPLGKSAEIIIGDVQLTFSGKEL